jgi:hypothetical protein
MSLRSSVQYSALAGDCAHTAPVRDMHLPPQCLDEDMGGLNLDDVFEKHMDVDVER